MTTPIPPPDAVRSSRLGRGLAYVRGISADLTPLRTSVSYRRLWFGATVSNLGTQMTLVAVPFQVYELTQSSFAVGMLGAAGFVPLVLFGLLGGAVADAVDRRRLAMATSSGSLLLSLVLVAHALVGLNWLWLLYVVTALQAALFAADSPARAAMIPRLLPAEQIPAANALGQLTMALGFTVGPLAAGVIVEALGLATAYAVDAASFLAALYAVTRLPAMAPVEGGRRAGWTSVLEGLHYLRTRRNVLMTFLVDIDAMVVAMPRALFPAIAVTQYGGGAATVGLLYAAPALGALGGAIFSGRLGRVRRQGAAILVSVVIWGSAVAGFGLSPVLWLGVLFLMIAGAADMVSAVYRSTILQVATPDEMRGRLQGVFITVVSGGPRLGDVRAGAMAAMTSPVTSVVAGGVACVIGVLLLAVRFPGFARYDARAPVP